MQNADAQQVEAALRALAARDGRPLREQLALTRLAVKLLTGKGSGAARVGAVDAAPAMRCRRDLGSA